MTGLLQHLAQRAKGEQPTGMARLSLPARFAETPVASDLGEDAAIGAQDLLSPPLSAPATPERSPPLARQADEIAPSTPRHEPGNGRAPAPRIAHPSVEFTAPDARLGTRPPPSSPAGGRDAGAAPMLLEPAAAAPLRGSPSIAPNSERRIASARPTAAGGELPRVASAPVPSAAPQPPQQRLQSAPPQRPALPIAPLREATVAGRLATARHEQPIVHVTIDRIDVRAPEPPERNPEPRRPRPRPTVSLADYLRADHLRESAQGGR